MDFSSLEIQGAKWDNSKLSLVECNSRDLHNFLPILHLIPTENKSINKKPTIYECPVYRTQMRGSSALGKQNYIFSLYIPTPRISSNHWIHRSVAAFITPQLD